MTRIALAALIVAASVSAAAAQKVSAEQRQACSGDYNKLCKGTMPGGGRILACLRKNHAQLSPACAKVIDARK